MTDSELAAILLLLIMSLLVVVSGTMLFVVLGRQKRPRLAMASPLPASRQPSGPRVAVPYRSTTPSAFASRPRVPSMLAPLRRGRWPAAQLMIRQGPLRGLRIPVGRPILALGRSDVCDISLPDPQTSRQHARLEWRSDGLYLIDTNSTNGTYVNRHRVAEHRLRGGEQVRIGSTVFAIQLY